MIINLFSKQNELKEINFQQEEKVNNIKNQNIDIVKIQKYIIDNYIEYIKQENYDAIREKIKEYIYNRKSNISIEEESDIENKTINKMFGYHILQKYIDNVEVSDIRVVKYDLIYIKQKGKWEKVNDKFENEEEFNEYIRYCVLKNDSNINFETPLVTVSDKKYKLRIEAGIEPVNTMSASLVIRIHRHDLDLTLEKLFLQDEMLNAQTYKLLLDIISQEKSIVICGKGGSGKTSLLRAIIEKIPNEKAITTNEETSELYIKDKNIIQRQVLNSRQDSKKITLETLTKHCLVMTNDIIVIGELKGQESAYFFDSISTGHQGLATLHSQNTELCIDRLVTLIKRNISFQNYKEEFIKKMLADSLDIIIFMKDYKVKEIASIIFDKDTNQVKFKYLYKED